MKFATGPTSTVWGPNGLIERPSEVPPEVPRVGFFPVTSEIAEDNTSISLPSSVKKGAPSALNSAS